MRSLKIVVELPWSQNEVPVIEKQGRKVIFLVCIWGRWISFLGKEGLPGILRPVLYPEGNCLALDSIYMWDLTSVRMPCDKPPQNMIDKGFLRGKLRVCFQVGLLFDHFSTGFVKTLQHLVLLFLAVLSHSLIWVKIKMFVTVNFASLCLKSKWKNPQCQFVQKGVFRTIFTLSTFICNTCTYFVFSVICGLFNYTMGILTVVGSDTEKAWPKENRSFIGLKEFFQRKRWLLWKGTWRPSVC